MDWPNLSYLISNPNQSVRCHHGVSGGEVPRDSADAEGPGQESQGELVSRFATSVNTLNTLANFRFHI